MKNIFQKELRMMVRDRRLLILGSILVMMLVVALWAGFARFTSLYNERKQLNEVMRKDWEEQEEKHAHSAAHYGTFIFTPQPPLSFFDFGILQFVGSSIRVEAHLQQDAQFAAAVENGSSIRFGDFTTAMVMQLLLPLLLIFLAYNAISGEKEQQTLKLLLVQGASMRKIIWQKILAYIVLAAVMLTLLLLASVIALKVQGFGLTTDLMARLLMLWSVYLIYYFIVVAVTVSVSALSGSSKNALLTMISLWLGLVVLLPKYTTNLGDHRYPLPSKKAFQLAIRNDVQKGVDGHNPSNQRTKAFTDSILKAQGVDSVSQLKINIDGLVMQEDEDYRAMVTRKYFGQLYKQVKNQNRVSQWASFLDPAIAVRDLSMSVSQTDYASQVEFEQQVQDYRLYMMRYLNEYMSYNNKPGDWDTKAPREVFLQLKKFNYQPPSLWASVRRDYGLLLLSLVVWMILAVLLVQWSSRKMNML
jgi:ABC-2 type transport system permease protein